MSKFRSTPTRVFLLIFWFVAIVLPIVTMLSHITRDSLVRSLTSPQFLDSLVNSLTTSAVSTLLSVTLAVLLSCSVLRSNIKFKGLFNSIFVLPMLIPSISHGMGLTLTFGNNGILKSLLPESFSIYGFTGIVLGSLMYTFPVAYLMIYDIFKYEDSSPYEASEVLGLSKLSTLRAVTLPYLIKPLVSTCFAVFTMTLTDYGVPLTVGGQCTTLSVMMYREVVGMLDFGKGSVLSLILLLPAVIACGVDMICKSYSGSSTRKDFIIRKSTVRDFFCYVSCTAVSLVLLTPVVIFTMTSFVSKYPSDLTISLRNVATAMKMNVGTYLINSVIIASFTSVVGTVVSVISAYITSRTRGLSNTVIHLLAISSLAVPGIVLGLSYVMTFKGSALYGTFAILILVNMMHFFSSPYLMARNTFSKLNPNLESVGSTLGVGRLNVILNVILPSTKSTIVEMLTYFFVNSMMTISAVSFLFTTSTKPLALTINQFEGQMQIECAAFVSLLILVVNIIVKSTTHVIKRRTAS